MMFKGTTSETFEMADVGYVDDVTLGIILVPKKDQVKEAVDYIQDTGHTWEEEIYTMGGRLELTKCFWLILCV